MKTYRILVDGRAFPIADEQELVRTKRRMVIAVRRNGGFVTLRTVDGRAVDVLVTIATRVSVEHTTAGGSGPDQSRREDFARYTLDELTFDADLAF